MSGDAPADPLMVVERAARLRNEAATGVPRPRDAPMEADAPGLLRSAIGPVPAETIKAS